jgi:protein-disulfide isomerase
MRRMKLGKYLISAILIAIACVTAYLVIVGRPTQLTFHDRAFPQGFRDLIFDGTVSAPDPIFGLPPTTRLGEAKPNQKEICDTLFRDPNSPIAGNRNGAIQLVSFFDYRCPYCKVLSGIMSAMPTDNVRLIFHEWAILGDSSVLAARAALAADRQEKYLAFHTRLMNARLIPTLGLVDAVAGELGIDPARLRADMNSDSITLALQRSSTLASALSLMGTPSLVVGRTIVQGEITRSQLERLIDDEMRRPSPKAC